VSSSLQGAGGHISPRARAEAAAWIAKLHGTERTAAVEAGWRQWLGEEPEHAAAWELATDTWSETDNLPSFLPATALSGDRHRAKTGFLRPVLAISAACVTLLTVVIFLAHGDSVTTALGEQRTLILPDGSRVELNTDTSLAVQFDEHARTVVLRTGEAYFNVTHDRRRPFVVLAGPRKVIAVGTSFLVRRDMSAENAVTVTLLEGRVAIAPISAPDVLPSTSIPDVTVLSAGKQWRARRNHPAIVDSPPLDKVTAWMRGQLIFDSTPLREAAREFNRYSDQQIRVTSPDVAAIPIGGVFRIGDSASFAAAVAQSHHLKLITREHELLLEPAPSNLPAEESSGTDP